ncbi:dihydroneopterin aldolase [Poseidonocella sedimentorum]|uniref:dihydroneopterin aldolase n=1 Tax=Poseidonocella sedimentorum TaxID=871652 RepID=A0A1I6DYU2_9RHOB|nr:dihydroneopterin aldolase [Poseidonocella sedimentorum]SFR10593.1 dihydroneopterin aldolase [Poseidonocella sedimentorum]
MSNEVRLAFAHPDERAAASSMGQDRPLDRISLRDHTVEVEIGAFQAERGISQRICFNVVVEVAPMEAPLGDDVDRILSYDRVTEAIAFELRAERLNLLETLADRVAERILHEPQAVRVFVRIEKLDRGPGALGVEIVRARRDLAAPEDADPVPHPRVIYVSNEAFTAPHLKSWIDQLDASADPVILCVGAPDMPAPRIEGRPLVQRRVDLLAIEQNAWVLASCDRRCVVTGSRTELDWGMRNGQLSVWAPSKVVLDAVGGPMAAPQDALELVSWFAGEVKATELTVVGARPPASAPCPVSLVSVQSPTI